MTPEELQEVVAAVIAALKTNGKTIDQLTAVTSLADTDNLEISNGKKVSFGKLKELVAAAVTVSAEEIKGWEMIESTDDLPEDPTQAQQEKAYVIAETSTMYVYVGYGGDTLDGLYQSLNMKGEDGAPGPPGADGHDGVDLGEVALVNNLTEGGEGSALTAEQGKILKGMVDELQVGIVSEDAEDIPVEIIDPDVVVFNDEVAESIALENWDTNHDGKISLEEAAAVTSFSTLFKGKNVITTAWMQYFPNVTSLVTQAFNQCLRLASVVIPGNIKTINSMAFNANTACTSLVLEEGVQTIKSQAFKNNAFASVVIPSTVTSIEWGAFQMSALTTVTSKATTPPTSNSTSYKIFNTTGITAIYVPAASVEAYKANQYWSPWANVIQAIPTT